MDNLCGNCGRMHMVGGCPDDMARYWEKKLKNGTVIYGVTGDGTHTHEGIDKKTGKPIILIKNEKTGKHPILWKL